MRYLRCTFLLFAVSATAAVLEINPPAANTNQALAIVGGLLIDGRGGPPITNSIVIIRGAKIEAVGTQNSTVLIP